MSVPQGERDEKERGKEGNGENARREKEEGARGLVVSTRECTKAGQDGGHGVEERTIGCRIGA